MQSGNNNGFTLIELMVTIAILGVLAGIAIPAYKGYITTSHKTQCENEIASIKLAESQFFLEQNAYFSGAGVVTLNKNSNFIYTPSTTAAGTNATSVKECDYAVTMTKNTYTITATPAKGGHLVGQPNIVLSGP